MLCLEGSARLGPHCARHCTDLGPDSANAHLFNFTTVNSSIDLNRITHDSKVKHVCCRIGAIQTQHAYLLKLTAVYYFNCSILIQNAEIHLFFLINFHVHSSESSSYEMNIICNFILTVPVCSIIYSESRGKCWRHE